MSPNKEDTADRSPLSPCTCSKYYSSVPSAFGARKIPAPDSSISGTLGISLRWVISSQAIGTYSLFPHRLEMCFPLALLSRNHLLSFQAPYPGPDGQK